MSRWICSDPAGIYLFIVNNGNTTTVYEICSKLKIKTTEYRKLTSFWWLHLLFLKTVTTRHSKQLIYHFLLFLVWTCRSSHPRYSIKKMFLKIPQKLTGKYLCQGLFLNKIAAFRPATLLQKRLRHRCFPVNFAKIFRTPL